MNAVIWAIVGTAWAMALLPPLVRWLITPPRPELVDWERKGWAR